MKEITLYPPNIAFIRFTEGFNKIKSITENNNCNNVTIEWENGEKKLYSGIPFVLKTLMPPK